MNNFFNIALTVFLYLSGFITVILALTILTKLANLIDVKANSIEFDDKIKKEENDINNQIILKENIESAEKLLGFINNIIDTDVGILLNSFIKLNKPYDVMRLDNDAKNIAEKVYQSINPDILRKLSLVVTTEYILTYISEMTITRLLNYIVEYNSNLHVGE